MTRNLTPASPYSNPGLMLNSPVVHLVRTQDARDAMLLAWTKREEQYNRKRTGAW